MDVLFIWRGPSPYRVDFFNELGKYCNLTVFFELDIDHINDRDPKWFDRDCNNFTGVFLKNIYIGSQNYSIDLIKKVLIWKQNNKAGIIIIGMYSTPSQAALIMALKMRRIKYLISSDGGFIKKDHAIAALIKNILIGGAWGYLSTGKMTTDYLVHYGALRDKVYVYPFTTYKKDALWERFSGDVWSARQNLGLKQDKKYILAVGQFIYRKGFDILLKAAHRFPENAEVLLIGGQPTQEYIQECRSLPIDKVHFIEFQPREILAEYYKASDVFVFPTREDIWGLVINEAMTYGLPIVTTDVCIAGVELVETGENGYIVPAENADAIAEATNRILDDEVLARSMSKANKQKMEYYTIEEMARTHVKIFEALESKDEESKNLV